MNTANRTTDGMDMMQYEGGFRKKMTCAHCGKVFVARSRSAKFCKACRKAGYGGDHFHEGYRPFERHAEVNASLAERERMARALGMSYGQYMASRRSIGR